MSQEKGREGENMELRKLENMLKIVFTRMKGNRAGSKGDNTMEDNTQLIIITQYVNRMNSIIKQKQIADRVD